MLKIENINKNKFDYLYNKALAVATKDFTVLSPKDLKAIRKDYNLSQRCFAQMLKIKLKTLQNYEIGRTIPPSPAVALFILARNHKSLFNKNVIDNVKHYVY